MESFKLLKTERSAAPASAAVFDLTTTLYFDRADCVNRPMFYQKETAFILQKLENNDILTVTLKEVFP